MKIALVGNQNCGKTTLFNTLTGMNQKIGNWPGVTIDRKSGVIKGSNHQLIDLPGTYSLSPYSEEEKITRDFLLNDNVDLIVNVVDVTSIERSLYLTTQLMEFDIPVIVVLNMIDLLPKKGIEVDLKKLEKVLEVKVVGCSALKNIGVEELKETLDKVNVVKREIFDRDIENSINEISRNITKNKRFISVKVLEKDGLCEGLIGSNKEEISKLENRYGISLEEVIADQRYRYIIKIKKECFVCRGNKESVSDKLDKIFLNKWLALPIFGLIMFFIYYLSGGGIGDFVSKIIGSGIGYCSQKIESFLFNSGNSRWLISLIVDGIVGGIGAVISFVPQLFILFLCISILETSGYMSRIAFFLDVMFRKLGLSGKSLVPFILGSGCSVPGIMASRTIENKDEREKTIILTPFIPCSAKLPIIALFSGFFFPGKSGFVSSSLYFLSILIVVVLSIIFKKVLYKEESNNFISELPEYKIPNFNYVIKDVWDKVISFIKRAGSVIFISSILIWFMLSFSFKFEYGVDINNSILAGVGKCFSWLFYPMLGELSWGAAVSAIQGLVAKEQVVSSMIIISNMNKDVSLFEKGMFSFFTGASGYAYVVFNLFSAPCFGAIGAMKKELGSLKKTLLAVLLQVVVAWVIAVIVYIVGTLIIGG